MASARVSDFLEMSELPPMNIIFGTSTAMELAREKLERIAATPVPVLLQGESGTGKDILARLLHGLSDRSRNPLVKVTCPAIPHSLLESELFGFEKGAFTGAYTMKRGRVELAHMGSLFLDEIGSLENASQAKLLQVLQDGTFMRVGAQESRRVDVRLICAANGNLRQQAEQGNFRLDFLFRVSAVTIDLAPLRQRIGDLPLLADYFLASYARTYQREPKPLSREILNLMMQYHWPGNIRQLENMLRGYVLIGNEEAILADLVPANRSDILPEIDLANPISLKTITKNATRDLEREIILRVLQANGWSRQKTARWLNISYRSLLYKLQESDVGTFRSKRNRVRSVDENLSTAAVGESVAND
ncbi:MAG TPA: sigma 54-interacting transcriptional regulator [Terracidiphilus sp.]|nr:sigma 54-interacting transcriptional regulator [Terracidiphilus sp.]